LPPAYSKARFCTDPDGHLQAVGTDARGRLQYRYHADYRAEQEEAKFSRCLEFGKALPRLRKQLQRDLKGPPASREAVLAAIVRIMDTAYLRVGNEAYARENKSFGITTLRNRHARLTPGQIRFQYRGKGGIERTVRLSDRSLARVVRHCQDLPGQQLFQYRDESGELRRVTSGDVNAYIRDVSGADLTAKHFRTWHASVIAFGALLDGGTVKSICAEVSDALGNTPAIARKSYIHPRIIAAAGDGETILPKLPRASARLSQEERGLIAWLSAG
jgi:DNA topoisomerase I